MAGPENGYTERRAVLSKEEMAAKIVENLSETEANCKKQPQILTIKLSYVPSIAADGDENDKVDDIAHETVYSLKLLVSYMPNSNYEGGNL